MKSKFFLALVSMAAMFTGCNNDAVENLTASKTTSFTVAVDNGVNTRATVADPPTRYIMELYKGATATGTAHATPVVQDKATFDVVLEDGQEYTALFWADYGTASGSDNEYDASDLRAVKAAKQPTKMAFSGMKSFTVGTTVGYTDVTLSHAVAQVTFEQTAALNADASTLTVTYPEKYSLNVEDNSGTKLNGNETHTFNYAGKSAGILGTSYYIAGEGNTKAMMTVKAKLNQDTEKEIPNVTFERNYRTNIKGKYNDVQTTTFTITCDDAWSSPDNEGAVTKPATNLKVGDYYPAGATKATATGVVFWVNPDDATKGKIVSMDEPSGTLIWCTYAANGNLLIRSDTDGAENTAKVTNDRGYTDEIYPSVAWCVNKGEGWYMPAKDELITLYTVWSADKEGFNAKLNTNIASDKYWASTEDNGSYQYYVDFNDGSNENDYKAITYHYVRAILAY